MQTLYKPGQGVWSRGATAAALVALGIYAALETRTWLVNRGAMLDAGIPTVLFVGFAVLAFYLSNVAKPAELLIETEIEMRKVTWPTPAEVLGATAVVIVVTLILGFYLYALDLIMGYGPLNWLGATPHKLTP